MTTATDVATRKAVAGLFAFIVGLSGSVAAAHLIDRSSMLRPGQRLGLLDIDAYCAAEHGDRALAVLIRPETAEWRCAKRTNGVFATTVVDLDAACRWEYEVSAHARQTDPQQPLTLACFYGPG